MKDKLYYYKAIVKSVYDGDSCTVDIDMGLGIWIHNEKLRFTRIDAPEMKGMEKEKGKRSRDFLRKIIDDKEIIIQSKGRDKYGRLLAEIWIIDENGNWINVNDLMVENGYAVYQDY